MHWLQRKQLACLHKQQQTVLIHVWCTGTQNYSAQASTQYGNNQAFATLFKGQTSTIIGEFSFQTLDSCLPDASHVTSLIIANCYNLQWLADLKLWPQDSTASMTRISPCSPRWTPTRTR